MSMSIASVLVAGGCGSTAGRLAAVATMMAANALRSTFRLEFYGKLSSQTIRAGIM